MSSFMDSRNPMNAFRGSKEPLNEDVEDEKTQVFINIEREFV